MHQYVGYVAPVFLSVLYHIGYFWDNLTKVLIGLILIHNKAS